jgi:replicative DNA helicase
MTLNSDSGGRAERALLGSILTDNSVWPKTEGLSRDDFSSEHNGRIFATMCAMFEDQRPVDVVTLADAIGSHLEKAGGPDYLSGLLDGCVPENAGAYVKTIRRAAFKRRVRQQIHQLAQAIELQTIDHSALCEQSQNLLLLLTETDAGDKAVRRFADIPDVLRMDLPPLEYIVPALGIARNTITLYTGRDGDAKTYLAQRMACAVSRGEEFLGMPCQNVPVLYLDLENPAYVVQDRLRAMIGDEAGPNLRFWGSWHKQQPPQAGSSLLLTLCQETRPLLIIDPFRYFHEAEENDSTEMAGVMKYLRACAASGAAVVLLHHPAKQEGSTGRGSSAIRGACDLAFLHSLDKESQLITLKVDKNRNGENRTLTIRADFENGRFQVTDSPYITSRNEELAKLEAIIRDFPGITQNSIAKQAGMMKARAGRLLKEGSGTRWQTSRGSNRSILYYPISGGSVVLGGSENQFIGGSVVLSPKGENHRTTGHVQG